jgi:ketosteroid isomerase-like protein
MTDRDDIERLIRETYAARVRGDVDGVLRAFDPGAVFEVVGNQSASPVPSRAVGGNDIRERIATFVRNFPFESLTLTTVVVEGSKAAARSRVRVKSNITGEIADTEFADFIEVKDGRIVSFVQFIDTALAARLATK